MTASTMPPGLSRPGGNGSFGAFVAFSALYGIRLFSASANIGLCCSMAAMTARWLELPLSHPRSKSRLLKCSMLEHITNITD